MQTTTGWRRDMPAFLGFLEQKLACRVRRHEVLFDLRYYEADLSAWKLRFSDLSPLIYVSASEVATLGDAAVSENIGELLRARNLTERQPLVLTEGDGQELKRYLRINSIPAAVLDGMDQQEITDSRRPTAEFLDRVVRQMTLGMLSPYEINKPVTGSRFFGRESDVRRIQSSGDTNYAVMGIRRIGKTSLLRELERRLREQAREDNIKEAEKRVFFMDCSPIRSAEDLLREIVRHYHPHELVRISNRQFPLYFPDFLRRMKSRYGGQLILLLDEFDVLLNMDVPNESLLNVLRTASNEGHCRFVIAGFRDLLAQSSQLHSPLLNFAKTLRLKEFSREDAGSMILGPLSNLRVQVERENEVVERIFEETAGQPHLIQFHCSYIVDRLDRNNTRRLSPEDLLGVYDDENFRASVLDIFMDNTTHLEKAMVFALISEASETLEQFDQENIERSLLKQGISITLDDMEYACRNLELAGVFAKQGWHYRFAIPLFPRILNKNYNVCYLLQKLKREGI